MCQLGFAIKLKKTTKNKFSHVLLPTIIYAYNLVTLFNQSRAVNFCLTASRTRNANKRLLRHHIRGQESDVSWWSSAPPHYTRGGVLNTFSVPTRPMWFTNVNCPGRGKSWRKIFPKLIYFLWSSWKLFCSVHHQERAGLPYRVFWSFIFLHLRTVCHKFWTFTCVDCRCFVQVGVPWLQNNNTRTDSKLCTCVDSILRGPCPCQRVQFECFCSSSNTLDVVSVRMESWRHGFVKLCHFKEGTARDFHWKITGKAFFF